MKFSMPGGVAKIRSNQTETVTCYMNALQKVAKREDVAPAVMTIHSEPMNVDHETMDKEIILNEGLDPRIIDSDSLASPVEELEAFSMNPSKQTQVLQVGVGTLGPTWKGPYKIIEDIWPGTYRLEGSKGRETRHP
ncbi:Uncharacterized protein Adt_27697 [Abeliophyllum distichum]|uniref:Reverse transcriptase domain-containing protein n=1 Tax=Abeliophyllum distichum TaxID=126358 RepID=A0ABD1RYJ7_9LAMI